MRRILIIFVVFIVLLGGGVGVWKFGLSYLEELQGEDEAAEEELADPLFITLDPITLPVIVGGVVTRHMTLLIQLEVPGLREEGKLREHITHLTDAYLTELHGLMGMRYIQERGADPAFIKERLTMVTERVVGPERVHEVVLQSVAERRAQREGVKAPSAH